LLALGRAALESNRLDEAESLLKRAVSLRPGLIEAQARLGEVLLRKRDDSALARWHAELPKDANGHPEVWVVRGAICRDRGDLKAAIRCFREAVALEANHRLANYQLGQLLRQVNRNELAKPFLERARILAELATRLDRIQRGLSQNQVDPEMIRRVVELTESLGRWWEAWGWTQFLLRNHPSEVPPPWAVAAVKRLQPRLRYDLPRTAKSAVTGATLAAAPFPFPDWGRLFSKVSNAATPKAPDGGDIRFQDHASRAGIDFRYFNGADASTRGARLLETTGGGVGVIDYDGDGWPDLYFTQGAPWPSTGKPHGYSDRLYRNLHVGRFRDETIAAGLGDADFGQGVAAGDYDGDGFPDLYVANLGQNRLYRNNGDGTFTEATAEAGLQRTDWTTSCLIADLNGDGLPDLYDVNYVASNDLSRICSLRGKPFSCSPTSFAAAQDRVFLNRGDGRFEDVTDSAGIVAAKGYGLGILAADFDGSGRLSLFVANDQTPNFFFVNRAAPGGPLKFTEQAAASGLATDAEGRPQGSMGIAFGDADGDGRFDLFVTNFYAEPNAFYRGTGKYLFADESQRAGLRGPSHFMLGFGTQFLDGDLDGRQDLVVANGHIDDLSAEGIPYRMRPQFFHNLGGGRFKELSDETLGAFFARPQLGRGLARLDWNRDGREDFVVSQIRSRAALVTNVTPGAARFIAVSLRGGSSRDAIGTTVRVRFGDRIQSQQLVAGDGYQASNERKLVFGLGQAHRADSIEVRWPNGKTQTFGTFPSGTDVLFIEGRRRSFLLP
jgi:tetratricopeptide (TPR) repeat protein